MSIPTVRIRLDKIIAVVHARKEAKQAFLLRYADGLSVPQIAVQQGRDTSNVRKSIKLIRKKLDGLESDE